MKATRYHDISCGHRVVGHESKCRHLHGHNYRIHFTCESATLDAVGRVVDFNVIKERLCMWVEQYWDHKFLAWFHDPVMSALSTLHSVEPILEQSFVLLPFNPTAENMAHFLLTVVGPQQLEGTGVTLVEVRIEETAKCSVSCSLEKR